MLKVTRIFVFYLLLFSEISIAKTITYNFDISEKVVNFTGKPIKGLAINNTIPGPTISATVGDTLKVTFNNKLSEETSIHWHGVLLPNSQDGVPYLTTPPIKPNSSFTYEYKITHPGTYWYHSHSGLQEQRGLYGGLIFHPKLKSNIKADKDYMLVLSDWTNEHPKKVIANIKKDGDYYALKKKSVQSWVQVIKNGPKAIKNRFHGSWTRMGPMDISDVGYDAFLANGRKIENFSANPNETIRLRLVNAAASSYFNVEFAGGLMKVVAADGVNIEPINVKRLRIAIAETYDVIVSIPDKKSYELRATSEDGTGYSSTYIGSGEKILAPDIPKPNLFLVDHNMHANHGMHRTHSSNKIALSSDHSMHNHHNHNNMHSKTIKYMTNYSAIKSIKNTTLPNSAPQRVVTLNLTGNMERYVWSFNNKTLKESDKIMIKKGERVKLVLNNTTMMHHPIHLHGHFFRVLNSQGDNSPLKHTVNVPPMDKIEIEFLATEDKDWFFHCHNLYHMKSGMTRIISYEGSSTTTRETIKKLNKDPAYYSTELTFLSNMTKGHIRTSNTRNALELEYDFNYKKEYDIDLNYERSITRFLDLYVGTNIEREGEESSKTTAVAGIKYVLPLLLESNLRYDSKNKLRLSLSSNLQLTERTNFSWMYNTNDEYRLTLIYEINKNLQLATSYDSDFKLGAGIQMRF